MRQRWTLNEGRRPHLQRTGYNRVRGIGRVSVVKRRRENISHPTPGFSDSHPTKSLYVRRADGEKGRAYPALSVRGLTAAARHERRLVRTHGGSVGARQRAHTAFVQLQRARLVHSAARAHGRQLALAYLSSRGGSRFSCASLNSHSVALCQTQLVRLASNKPL
jgi:hypothetical protein